MPAISDSVEIEKEMINFWFDEAVIHHLKVEVKARGSDFFQQRGYDSVDIVFGADHGACGF